MTSFDISRDLSKIWHFKLWPFEWVTSVHSDCLGEWPLVILWVTTGQMWVTTWVGLSGHWSLMVSGGYGYWGRIPLYTEFPYTLNPTWEAVIERYWGRIPLYTEFPYTLNPTWEAVIEMYWARIPLYAEFPKTLNLTWGAVMKKTEMSQFSNLNLIYTDAKDKIVSFWISQLQNSCVIQNDQNIQKNQTHHWNTYIRHIHTYIHWNTHTKAWILETTWDKVDSVRRLLFRKTAFSPMENFGKAVWKFWNKLG